MAVPKNTLFRSADMSLTQLYISNEIGRDVVSALGEVGEVQFRDVSIAARRRLSQAPAESRSAVPGQRRRTAIEMSTDNLISDSLTPRPLLSKGLSHKRYADLTTSRDSFVSSIKPSGEGPATDRPQAISRHKLRKSQYPSDHGMNSPTCWQHHQLRRSMNWRRKAKVWSSEWPLSTTASRR